MVVSKSFYSRGGLRYEVEFTVERKVELPEIADVKIACEPQQRKFVGFKTTTCEITFVSKDSLYWLYTENPQGILVRVMAADRVLFVGYVVPFVLSEPKNEYGYITIDCVDAITASKDLLYESVYDDGNGGDAVAEDVVKKMIEQAGGQEIITSVVYHVNFGDFSTSDSTFSARVAQAGFLQDKMTTLDALSALCQFFGYTCMLAGPTLYFFDELGLGMYSSEDMNAIEVYWTGSRRKLAHNQSSPFRIVDIGQMHADGLVDIEQSYDAIQITPIGSEVSVLLPDVCAMDNVIKNTDGRGNAKVSSAIYDGGGTSVNVPMMSAVMDMTQWDSESYMTPGTTEFNGITAGCMMVRNYKITEQFDQYRGYAIYSKRVTDGKNYIWVVAKGREGSVGRQHINKSYSHTGGAVAIRCGIRYVEGYSNKTKFSVENPDFSYVKFLQLKFGNKYYNGQYYAYKDGSDVISEEFMSAHGMQMTQGGSLAVSKKGSDSLRNECYILVPDDGLINCEISWNVSEKDEDYAYYYVDNEGNKEEPYTTIGALIDRLEVVGLGDDIPLDHEELYCEIRPNPKTVLNVDIPLTTRRSNATVGKNGFSPIGVNARPGVVVGTYFPCGRYMNFPDEINFSSRERMPISGILMRQLKERYRTPRKRITVTVEGLNIKPYESVRYDGRVYTIEGYEKDLVNNTTRLTIN